MASADKRLSEFLSALQIADSFFPTGAYAHSHGLEALVRRGLVRTAADVGELLENQLGWSIVPADGVALLNAHRVGSRPSVPDALGEIAEIDWFLNAMKLPRETRLASCQLGRRLLDETRDFPGGPLRASYAAKVAQTGAPGLSPIALAVVAVDLAIPEDLAFGALCHGYAVAVLGAALRLLPITHRDVQAILRALQQRIRDEYAAVIDRSWHDLTSLTPELDLAAIGHANDEIRMFAS